MGKKSIYITHSQLNSLKENVELDKYMIGFEGDANSYAHVVEENNDNIDKKISSPDKCYYNNKILTDFDNDSYAFIYCNGSIMLGLPKSTHTTLMLRACAIKLGINGFDKLSLNKQYELLDDKNFEDEYFKLKYNKNNIRGRVWKNDEIISCWRVNDIPTYSQIIKSLEKKMNYRFNNPKITINGEIIPLSSEPNKKYGYASKKEMNNIENIHLMNQQGKREKLTNFRKNKESKLGKQLSSYDEDGNFKSEMPLAQWRALHSTSEGKINSKRMINEEQFDKYNIDKVYSIRYEVCEPDEEDYDAEEYDSYEDFYNDNVSYDIDFWDMDNESLGWASNVYQFELEDYFDDEDIIQKIINKEGRAEGNDTYLLDDLINTKVDINNPYEVNNMVRRLFYCHDNYYKGLGGYILADGTLVDFGDAKDHNSISSIDGMTVGKFMSLGNIRIRYNNIDLVKEPTYEQEDVLKQLINNYSDDEVYVDICTYKEGEWYASPVTSAKYISPNYRIVLGEINRYFSEGLKLKGGYNMYESKNIMKENFELEVDSNDVEVDHFKKQKTLPPNLWDYNENLNSRARLKLLDIADKFWDDLNIKWMDFEDVILTGSICNYNWTKYSDIDLHLLVDYSKIGKCKDIVKDYFNTKKNEWNGEHLNLTIYGFPIEIYVQDINDDITSDGIYSLEKNTWINKPSYDDISDISPNKQIIKEKSAMIMTWIDDMSDDFYMSSKDSVKLSNLFKKISFLLKRIKRMRQNGLSRNGEMDSKNIVYKVLRQTKYLDKLWKLKEKTFDYLNSIS